MLLYIIYFIAETTNPKNEETPCGPEEEDLRNFSHQLSDMYDSNMLFNKSISNIGNEEEDQQEQRQSDKPRK